MIRRGSIVLALAASLLTPAPAVAQTTKLSRVLLDLIETDILLARPAVGFDHSAHFIGDQAVVEALFRSFNNEVISQVASFPTGSSSGGFTYTFDPALGTFKRATDSFGPSFAERALTVGKGKLNFGVNFQRASYSSFEGVDLDNGDVKFFLRHEPFGGAFFEGDIIETAVKMKLSTNTFSIFTNYGLSDRLDVAVTVPIVQASLNATLDATVLRLATEGTQIHVFEGGSTTRTSTSDSSKTGIGDILVRAKYRFASMPGGGMAFEVGARLPTGDEENLLGSGAAQMSMAVIMSTTRGKLAPHVNIGFNIAGDSDIATTPNEFTYRGGIDMAVRPTWTISADLLGRSLLSTDRLVTGETTVNFTTQAGVNGSRTLTEFQQTSGTLNNLLGAVGTKFAVGRNTLVSANLLFGLTSAGLRSKITPVFGIDYSF